MSHSLQLPRRYVFWQPIPSMHQMPFLDHLHDACDAEIVCVHADDIPADRIALGWPRPSASSVRLLTATQADTTALIAADDVPSLHIFSGLHCHPYVSTNFREAIARNASVGVISEAHDGHGVRGSLRRLRSSLDARRYGARIAPLLAMGRLGVEWYRDAGFRPETVFPFAYVAEHSTQPDAPQTASPDPFKLAYVGQLIYRKGVDLLFEALSTLLHAPWRLEVAGLGPLEPALRAQAAALGFGDRIVWHGPLPNQQVNVMLRSCDLLVLPSRFDGWGVVINEALAAGTPVVCTQACGAADLVAAPFLGEVVPPRSITPLADAIRERMHAGPLSSPARTAIRRHAARFSPATIANYFVEIINSTWNRTPPPRAPWRTVQPVA